LFRKIVVAVLLGSDWLLRRTEKSTDACRANASLALISAEHNNDVPYFACVLARFSLIEPRETAVKLGHKLVEHFGAVAVGAEQLRSQGGVSKKVSSLI